MSLGLQLLAQPTRSQTESQSVSPESDLSCQLPLLHGCVREDAEAQRG